MELSRDMEIFQVASYSSTNDQMISIEVKVTKLLLITHAHALVFFRDVFLPSNVTHLSLNINIFLMYIYFCT